MKRLAGCIVLGLTAALSYWFTLTPVSQVELHNTSPVLTDRNGTWLNVRTVDDGIWRIKADLEKTDSAFLDALITVEDKRFYAHSGVDGAAVLRALDSWKREGQVVSGASTLTMQLVRQYTPRPRTLPSKFIESLEALRFELHFSKSEILEQYLTRVSYGGNIEGLEAASRIYLGKSPRYLTPDEIALLIALPQAPEARRPDRNAQGARTGRNRILHRLAKSGLMSETILRESQNAAIPLVKVELPNSAWLTADRLTSSGQTVRSQIDLMLQSAVASRLSAYVKDLPETVNASALVIHAKTREVRAHAAIARRDHDGGWLDMTRATRSPGSTLKPFVYALGMDDGLIDRGTRLRDAPSRFGAYRPENFDRRYHGDVTMAQALQHSLNIPAVGVLDRVGGRRLDATLRAAGVETRQAGPDSDGTDAGLSLALGGTGLNAVDLATLYTAISNDGELAPLVWKKAVSPGESKTFQLMQADTAHTLRSIMADAPRPKGLLPHHLGRDTPSVAYKTGTSYGFRDSWAAGLSGEYVIVVWVGRPDGGPRPGVTGRSGAAPVLFGIADDLPKSTVRNTVENAAKPETNRLASADEAGPVILFPDQNSEIAMSRFGPDSKGVEVLVQSAYGASRVYIGDELLKRGRNGYRFSPGTPGFYTLKAVDPRGKTSQVDFRILAADQIVYPGF